LNEDTAARYRHFGRVEAPGVSDAYAALALALAEDGEVVDLVATLPAEKQQVNLVFGAARYLGAPVATYRAFRSWLLQHWPDVESIALSRATQTNEAGRCALYLPVLTRLPQPLALLEVGAAAGLCLHPDRYSYRYRTTGSNVSLDPPDGPSEVILRCAIDSPSVPVGLPSVRWRKGVDVNPIDPSDGQAIRWLEALIWPGQHDRVGTLHAAARIAARHPVDIVRADLIDAVAGLMDQAPADATLVVFHTAVLAYVDPEGRRRFADLMAAEPRATWISNEGSGVLPDVDAQVNAEVGGGMILAVNGRAVAVTGPHGQSYTALPR